MSDEPNWTRVYECKFGSVDISQFGSMCTTSSEPHEMIAHMFAELARAKKVIERLREAREELAIVLTQMREHEEGMQ